MNSNDLCCHIKPICKSPNAISGIESLAMLTLLIYDSRLCLTLVSRLVMVFMNLYLGTDYLQMNYFWLSWQFVFLLTLTQSTCNYHAICPESGFTFLQPNPSSDRSCFTKSLISILVLCNLGPMHIFLGLGLQRLSYSRSVRLFFFSLCFCHRAFFCRKTHGQK
jgi:hypothetical protein